MMLACRSSIAFFSTHTGGTMFFSGKTCRAATAVLLAALSLPAWANHGSTVFTSATCNPAANSVTVFGTNESNSPSGFAANVSVNGGPPFLSPIIFDQNGIPANSSGSFTFTNPQFVAGAIVVVTNNEASA